MNQYTIDGYTRISKARARRLYDAGAPVYMCPVKLRPGGPWYPETQILKPRTQAEFSDVTNAATFYTCSPGAGRYLAYYAKDSDRHAAWCAQVDAERDRNRHGGEVAPF